MAQNYFASINADLIDVQKYTNANVYTNARENTIRFFQNESKIEKKIHIIFTMIWITQRSGVPNIVSGMGKKFFAYIIVEFAIVFFVGAIQGKAEEKAYENREQRTNPKKKKKLEEEKNTLKKVRIW